ncbi:MAG: PLP-dependent aminotransferase family protein [Lachnospiraceae bacterium]|nr:PLP-dependent aminotransferase family protein [Lachnospiraceae bacterium]
MNDLTISLDAGSPVPLYEQIYQYLKQEIQNGGLPFGKRLPSTRNLANYLQVSRTTVDMAYGQLVSEGYIEAVPYRGYFVCELEGIYNLETECKRKTSAVQQVKQEFQYDFSPSGVDLNNFPHNVWRKLSKNILMEDNKKFFQLGDPQGEYEFRTTIAEYLHQARGMSVSPEQIVVGAGNDFLLLLLCNMFGIRKKFAMESPTYRKAYDLLSNLSNEVRIVEMDEAGMRIDSLEASGADIAYVMPSHHFPLGIVMPVKRRMQLLEWASRSEERYIIEDDYDSEFRYRGKPIPALQGFDRNGKVIYIGTFSKSIAPAIRVSYLVLPERLMETYRRRGRMISSTVSRVDQLLISDFLNGGYYERHLNKMRTVYKSRHDLLLEELKDFQNICTISGENAGVHILLTFHNGMTEEEAIRRAAEVGVGVYGLSRYFVGNENENEQKSKLPVKEAIVEKKVADQEKTVDQKNAMPESSTVILGYANVEENEIRTAVELLRNVW